MSRHHVTLYEADGTVRTTADFDDSEAAALYSAEAQVMAKAIGGWVEVSGSVEVVPRERDVAD